jgi:preprotein translocase subunit YajC
MGPVIVLAATIGLTWLLFILPQQRRIKAHQATVAALKVGDRVMTTSGMFGTITDLDDETFHLEVAPGTVVQFARGAADHVVTTTPHTDPAES